MIKKITAGVIIGVTVVVIVYDVWAASIGGIESTISLVLWENAKLYPIIPFAFGGLMGHLFFPAKSV